MQKETTDIDQIFQNLLEKYPNNSDPWGLSLKKARKVLETVLPFYKNYFNTRVFGMENIDKGPYMVISNHSGQIAIDGLLISTAFAVETKKPIILRPMIERFMMKLPFIGRWSLEAGAVLGDRQNCHTLLERGESVLVFPEGVSGVSKSTKDFYKLQKFTRGFIRLAITSKTPIVPVAVVGAEEFYPYVYQAKTIARFFKLPALPITPTFPWFGPLGAIPLPSPIDIYIGKPFFLPENLSPDAPDYVLDEHISDIQSTIQEMIEEGLKKKRPLKSNIELITTKIKDLL